MCAMDSASSSRRDSLTKLVLEGEVARAEADAARYGYQAVRLRLAATASLVFDDGYFAERALVEGRAYGSRAALTLAPQAFLLAILPIAWATSFDRSTLSSSA